jgi:hypothetical protein
MSPPEWVTQHWDACKAWLNAALFASPVQTYGLDHVRDALDRGLAQLWPTRKAAVVTEIVTYPTGVKGLSYWLAGGELEDVLKTHDAVERFARQQGCDFIEIRGRRGWQKAIRAYGFRPVGTYYLKELSGDGQQEANPNFH